MDHIIFVLGPVVFLAITTETFTGFAGAITAITLGAHFYPIDELVPMWVTLNLLMNGYIVWRYGGKVHWSLLVKQVWPFMVLGIIIGLFLHPYLSGIGLKNLLGVLVVVFAGRQLILSFRKSPTTKPPLSWRQSGFWQVLAGICQAIYATGGPFLVYSLSRMNFPKAVFRATMCTVWGSLNGLLVAVFLLNGRINSTNLTLAAYLLPALPLGIILGDWMHGRVNEKQFKIIIYLLLLVAGLTLVF